MVTTVVLWASAFVGIRAIGPHFSPGSLTLGRLAVAAVVLSLLVLPQLLKSRLLPKGREWWPILAYGAMWFGGYNVALNAAEHVLDAGTSALLINVNPILVAVMAGIFLKEGFPRWLIIGSLVAFAGVALIAWGTGHASRPGESPTADVAGVLLCLLAAVLAAVSVIIQKPVLRKFPAAQATWFGILVGALCCLPFTGQLVSRGTGRAPGGDAGTGLSRSLSHGDCVHHLGVRALADRCRQARSHHLPGAGHHHPDLLAPAGRDPHRARNGGRPRLPGGRGPDPAQVPAEDPSR
jgi:drug/metabolite transporter (DMT)-like permease